MLCGQGHLHGFSHTCIGAFLFAVLFALSGKYLAEFGLRLIGHTGFLPISWAVAFLSAAIVTFGHVVLDSEPKAPPLKRRSEGLMKPLVAT